MKKIIMTAFLFLSVFIMASCKKATEQDSSETITPQPTEAIVVTPTVTSNPSDETSEENTTDTPVSDNETQGETVKDITYDISEVSYISDGTIAIYYPQVAHMEDKEVQETVNATIKAAALKYLEGFNETQADNTLENDYIISWKGSKLLSIRFLGYYNISTAAYPTSYSYSVNIDLNTGNTVELSDMVKANDELLSLLKDEAEGSYLYFNKERELQEDTGFQDEEIRKAIKDYIFHSDYPGELSEADQKDAYVYSYFTKDSLGLCFTTVHAIGDYIQYEIKYTELIDLILTENYLWDDFSEGFQASITEAAEVTSAVQQEEFQIDENLIWKNINYVPDFSIIKDQSFVVNLENWGDVYFIAGSGEGDFALSSLYLYLADKNSNIIYEFPYFYGNGMMFDQVAAISFQDVNNDSLKDIIVIAHYMTGTGPDGARAFPVADVYFQNGDKFVTLPEVQDELNSYGQNESIDMIIEHLRNMDLRID